MDFQKAFDDCFETVKGYVDRSLVALHKRIDSLEARPAERGEKGDRGEVGVNGADGIGVADAVIDREGALIFALSDGRTKSLGTIVGSDGVDGKDGKDGVSGADGRDGVDGEPGRDGIDGKDGQDGVDGKDGAPGRDGVDGVNGKDGRDGVDGKDVDPEFVRQLVEEAVAVIPAPKNGIDGVNGKDGRDGVDGKDGLPGVNGKDGKDGLNGKDGLDAVSFIRDANGHLIATMNDGTTKDLGLVDGKDGAPGKDGVAGRDGADGFGFDDLIVEHDGLRKFTLKFTKGERVKSFDFNVPVMLDAGIYKSGTYERGDVVSHGGSMWIAQRDTGDKPGEGDAWRLSVKRGRDGKSAEPAIEKKAEPIRLR